MPLPKEVLDEIAEKMKEAEALIASAKDVVEDLRASGIDASKEEERLNELKADFKRMQMFYKKQTERLEE